MRIQHWIEELHKEQKGLLRIADHIENALTMASETDFSRRRRGLVKLRDMEREFRRVLEHCHTQEHSPEATLHPHLSLEEIARVDAEHEKIVRVLAEFREELKVATPDRATAMVIPGMEAANELRNHVAHEAKLLERIPPASAEPTHRRKAKTRKVLPHGARRSKGARPEREPRYISYTMEPHPEL